MEVTNVDKQSIVMRFYRVERWLWVHHMHLLSKLVWRLITIIFACNIPPTTDIAKGANIAHGIGIVLHQNTKVGEGTLIYQNVTIGNGNGPKIGRNCIIGTGAVILGDITIGDNVKIGANAVVTKDIPDDCTVVGIPGRIIKIGDRRVE